MKIQANSCANTTMDTFSLYIWCAETQASLFIFNCQKRHHPSFGLESASLVFKIEMFENHIFAYFTSALPKYWHKFSGEFLFAWNQTEFRFDVLSVPQADLLSYKASLQMTEPQIQKCNSQQHHIWQTQNFFFPDIHSVFENYIPTHHKMISGNHIRIMADRIFSFQGIFSNRVQFFLSLSFRETTGKQENSFHNT